MKAVMKGLFAIFICFTVCAHGKAAASGTGMSASTQALPAPILNKITDKSFRLSGKTEPRAFVVIQRNGKIYRKMQAATGEYSIPIPLQSRGTLFEVYAIDEAKKKSHTSRLLVVSQPRSRSKLLHAPLVRQFPELPRGCEVTSLTMLLNFAGVKADKMTLARQVKKAPTPYSIRNGKIYFGNPNVGFVGDMYTFSKPGFGVYHQPIAELASRYLPNRIVNLSGRPFSTVLDYVSAGHPVWVINTSWFSYVPKQYWQTWYTPQGPIRITKKEHSVLVTGYDAKYVYFNDPMDGVKNKRRPLASFIRGWEQYGRQAISYY